MYKLINGFMIRLKQNWILSIYVIILLLSFSLIAIIMMDVTLPRKIPHDFINIIVKKTSSIRANIEFINNDGEVYETGDNFGAENFQNYNSMSSYHTLWLRNNNVDNNILIRGWAFIPGENTTAPLVSYVLYDEATQEYYKLHTELEERPDVTEAFGQSGNYNYDLSGIVGNVPSFFLKKEHVYTVGIIYQHDDQYFLYMSDEQINREGEIN